MSSYNSQEANSRGLIWLQTVCGPCDNNDAHRLVQSGGDPLELGNSVFLQHHT